MKKGEKNGSFVIFFLILQREEGEFYASPRPLWLFFSWPCYSISLLFSVPILFIAHIFPLTLEQPWG